MFCTVDFPDPVDPRTQRSICLRAGKQGPTQRAQIETGAPNQQGCVTPTLDLADHLLGFTSPFSCGVVDLRWDKVNKVMGNSLTFLEGNLGRRDLNSLVDLDGIAIDDFAIESQRDFDTEGALAGRRWANNSNYGIWRRLGTHARENSMRKRITSQMRLSSSSPPISWLRENRM